jgi:hypothetical protein
MDKRIVTIALAGHLMFATSAVAQDYRGRQQACRVGDLEAWR